MSAVFQHPNYILQDGDRIIRKSSAPELTMSDELAVLTEIARYVQAKMIHQYGFETIPIPDDESEISTSILATSDWTTNSKLLMIVQNAVGSMMGIFSRSLCLEQGLSKGSMLSYIERARAAGYAVMILRPNTNSVSVQSDPTKAPVKVPIMNSDSPEIHALFVWENIISKADNIEQIAFLSYGNGASLCKELIVRQMVRSKEDESEANRIIAFASIEGSQIIEEDDADDLKKLLRNITVNMECSQFAKGSRLNYRREKLGCVVLSLGMPEGVTSNLHNVAMSISLALDPVFKFLAIGFGFGRNIGVSFSASFAQECQVDHPNYDIATPPQDDGDEGGDEDGVVDQATSAPKGGFFSRLFGAKSPQEESKASNPSKQKKRSASTINIGVEHEEKLTVQDFDLLKVVGKGAFGKVMLVRKKNGKAGGQIFAMKVLSKSVIVAKGQEEHTKSERAILCEIRHPFIVQLRFAFQSEDKLYLVTDYYNGGSLFYHLRKSRAFPEERAKFYGAQLLSALDHLHSQHIIYRDLKLENVLMDNLGNIALTDFGLSKQNIDQSNGATTFCGTAEYIAPELLKGQRYGAAVDWWSFGILLYEMMTGRTPFYDKNRKVIYCIA